MWLGLMSGSAGAEETAAFPIATPESQGIPTEAVRRVADEVEGYVKNGTIVGGELLIIKNRKTILHEAYGERDREDPQDGIDRGDREQRQEDLQRQVRRLVAEAAAAVLHIPSEAWVTLFCQRP